MIKLDTKYLRKPEEIREFLKTCPEYHAIGLDIPVEYRRQIIKDIHLITEGPGFVSKILTDDHIDANSFFVTEGQLMDTTAHTHSSLTKKDLTFWADSLYFYTGMKTTTDNSESTTNSWLDNQLKTLEYETSKDTNVPSY